MHAQQQKTGGNVNVSAQERKMNVKIFPQHLTIGKHNLDVYLSMRTHTSSQASFINFQNILSFHYAVTDNFHFCPFQTTSYVFSDYTNQRTAVFFNSTDSSGKQYFYEVLTIFNVSSVCRLKSCFVKAQHFYLDI